jgi:aryl-alcohol dehydrogenase-like predicted oxidoreductase
METIAAAIAFTRDRGERLLIDTADAYCLDEADVGHNEKLISRAVSRAQAAGDVLIVTKGGSLRPRGGWAADGSPAHLRQACEASLRRLGLESIELYALHEPDPAVPLSESVGALAGLRQEGKIQNIALSNVTVEQALEAAEIVPIAAIENELWVGDAHAASAGDVDIYSQHGMTFIAHSPLGGVEDGRRAITSLCRLHELAQQHGVSAHRVALAWLLGVGSGVLPIPGASRPETILDSLAASDLELTGEQIEWLAAPH